MSRRDWLIAAVLAVAALAIGWPNLRQSTLGLVVTGRCDHWLGGGRTSGCYEDREHREERRRARERGSVPEGTIPRPD